MVTSNFNNKESDGPDLAIDMNLLGGDPPASIKYIGNQNQLKLISECYSNISVNFDSLLLLQLM